MNVTVVGSGSWGSAFSRLLVRRGHQVQVLTLTREEAAQLNATHENPHFLPGVMLPPEIAFVAMDDADIGAAELVVYAVPTQVIRTVARWVAPRRAPARCSSRSPRATSSVRSSAPARRSTRRPAAWSPPSQGRTTPRK